MHADTVRLHQEDLLAAALQFCESQDRALSPRVCGAALATPRHLFIERYKRFPGSEWNELDEANISRHLPILYQDEGLGIYDDGMRVATISRPSLVFLMLEMLDVRPGMRVFEVGAGSGWNAALLGALVGRDGRVESAEIIEELAVRARRAIRRIERPNVLIHSSDAGVAHCGGEPGFDRVVFTAGAHDIPLGVRTRVRDGGRLLMVLKCPGGGDVLILFQRRGSAFEALESHACEFVPMLGAGCREEQRGVRPAELLADLGLASVPTSRRPFLAGGVRARDFPVRTFPLRSFLAATEPGFTPLADTEHGPGFALISGRRDSVVMIHNGGAACYGAGSAVDELERAMERWLALGLPSMLNMRVTAYPSGESPSQLGPGQWLMRRRDTDFVWSL